MIDLPHSHDIGDHALATKTIQWINLCQESIAAWKIKPSETVAKIAEHLSENTVAWPVTAAEKSLDPGYAKDIVITGDDTLKDEAPLGDTRPWTSRTAAVQPKLTGQAEQEEEQQEPLLNNRPRLVTWKCSCGEQLHDYYIERVPGSAQELQQRLRQENAFPSGFWQALWMDLCEYVELRHYACQDCQPNCRCIPPPDMIQPATNAQYYCVPRDPPLKPSIATNYLTHYFQNPDCIKSDALVGTLNQAPKRLGQCMATSGSQKVEAWGMEFEECWDRGRFRNAIFGIFVTGCLLFAILWSVSLKDVQSAFSISSFFMAVLAIVGGYVASAEPRIVHK